MICFLLHLVRFQLRNWSYRFGLLHIRGAWRRASTSHLF
jgi:hypothetical protein